MARPPESRSLGVAIDCDVDTAYAFLSEPQNFPRWASGLAGHLRQEAGRWIAETPSGPATIRFSGPNEFGVLDHWVLPPARNGQPQAEIHVPLRVIQNASGCELTLTLIRQPTMSDEQFAADADWVLRDLESARRLLESL